MKHLDAAQARGALADSVLLAVACLVSYLLVSSVLARVHSVSPDDDLLGGMWAVLATIFVNRSSLAESRTAAVSRVAATLVSFVYCPVYPAFLPMTVSPRLTRSRATDRPIPSVPPLMTMTREWLGFGLESGTEQSFGSGPRWDCHPR